MKRWDTWHNGFDLGEIAVREHVAAAHQLHPGSVREQLPLTRFELEVSRQGDEVTVTGDPTGRLDLRVVREFWTRWFDRGPWPVEDLLYGLIDRFVGRVVLEDPEAWEAVRGSSVLYLANHQVGIESLLLSTLLSGLSGVPTVTLAKVEHRTSWLGRLIQHCFSYPGIRDPKLMVFADRQDPVSMGKVLAGLAAEMRQAGRSVMVHVEGTRALSARHVVTRMSGSVLDLALQVGAPVVPVRCVGGLPVEPLEERIELPVGLGRQDFWLGRPIEADELAGLPLAERKGVVLERMRLLGPPIEDEVPSAPDVELIEQVRQWIERAGACYEDAAVRVVLGGLADPGEAVRRLLAAESAEDLADDRSPEGRWLHALGERLLGAGRDVKTAEGLDRNDDGG